MKMKKIFAGCMAIVMLCAVVSCQKEKRAPFRQAHDVRGICLENDSSVYFLMSQDTILSWKSDLGFMEWIGRSGKNYVLSFSKDSTRNVEISENGAKIYYGNGKYLDVVFLNQEDLYKVDFCPINNLTYDAPLAKDEIAYKVSSNCEGEIRVVWQTNFNRQIILESKRGEWQDELDCVYFKDTNSYLVLDFCEK